jgi:tetratricopeptide (TPR) repeat protein
LWMRSEYIFKHDILREVTYESVLKRLRKVYHGLVADWLIAQGAERWVKYNGLIAEHLLLADRKEQAAHFFIQAGEAALASYANGEAEAHFRKALELSSSKVMRAACLAGLGATLGRQGRREETEQTLCQAIDLYYEMGEYERVAHLYNRLSLVLWYGDYQKEAWTVCQEGLKRLAGAADSPGLAYLLAEAGRTCNRAIAMAERLGIVEAQVDASITLALIKSDPEEVIEILTEAVALSEAHGLLRTASRALHNLGVFYWRSLRGANQALQHSIKAAEILRQMGEIDNMISAITNVYWFWLHLGHITSVENYAAEFLQQSSATESQVKDFLKYMQDILLGYKGEWRQSMEYSRALLNDLHKGGAIQEIARENLRIADIILELNRYAAQDNLSEAEAALQENIDIQGWEIESRLMLAIISSRKGIILEARERLAEVPAHNLAKLQESFRLRAEAELAVAEKRWDEAISAWETLIKIYKAGEYRWFWARYLIDLGDALLGRDGPGDREAAEQAFRQSLEMFSKMGAPEVIN